MEMSKMIKIEMSVIFLFYELTIKSGWSIFYLVIGLISSKKYRTVAKNLVTVLKWVIQVKIYFYESLRKSKRKKND